MRKQFSYRHPNDHQIAFFFGEKLNMQSIFYHSSQYPRTQFILSSELC
jgi:hypothetical protein